MSKIHSSPLTFEEDASLMQQIAAGDSRAFDRLVKLHGGRMNTVAKRMMHHDDDASDALQDALICVFRKAGTFNGESKLSTWLHRVTVNSCLMKLRSMRRRSEVEIESLLPSFDETGHHIHPMSAWRDDPSEQQMQQEMREVIRRSIDRLPEMYRTVLMLRDIEGMDTTEVATMLDCTNECVKTRLHRARQALAEILKPMMTQQ